MAYVVNLPKFFTTFLSQRHGNRLTTVEIGSSNALQA